jgi:hypothetical protein
MATRPLFSLISMAVSDACAFTVCFRQLCGSTQLDRSVRTVSLPKSIPSQSPVPLVLVVQIHRPSPERFAQPHFFLRLLLLPDPLSSESLEDIKGVGE